MNENEFSFFERSINSSKTTEFHRINAVQGYEVEVALPHSDVPSH